MGGNVFDKGVSDLNFEVEDKLTPYSEEVLQEAKGQNIEKDIHMFDDSAITSDDTKVKNMEQEINILDDVSITSDDAKEKNMNQEIDISDDNSVTSVDFDHSVDSSDVEHESPIMSNVAADDFPSSYITEDVNEEVVLNKLVEMGFSKSSLTEEILKFHDYNIEHSIDYLCGNFEWDLMLEDLPEIRLSHCHSSRLLFPFFLLAYYIIFIYMVWLQEFVNIKSKTSTLMMKEFKRIGLWMLWIMDCNCWLENINKVFS